MSSTTSSTFAVHELPVLFDQMPTMNLLTLCGPIMVGAIALLRSATT